MALYWLADAANIWLSSRMSADSAALVIGAVLLVPIAALLIVHWISSHVEARVAHEHAAHAQVEAARDPGEAISHVTDQVQSVFRERPLMALVISLAAGAVIAKYPGAAKAMATYLARR